MAKALNFATWHNKKDWRFADLACAMYEQNKRIWPDDKNTADNIAVIFLKAGFKAERFMNEHNVMEDVFDDGDVPVRGYQGEDHPLVQRR